MEHSTWHRLLKEALPDHYFSKINQFMDQVYSQGIVYPPRDKVFRGSGGYPWTGPLSWS